jgi:pimeloyl-ACP methyl ester carboxylesterase
VGWSALIVVAIVVALALLVRLVEPSFAFFPLAGQTVTPRDLGLDFEPLTITSSDGERLQAWRLPVDTARAHIVYFHGNGGNLSVWAPILAHLPRRGYSVLTFDYRGYGLSTGRPTERGLYRDVSAVLERVQRDSDRFMPVVYWGRSLGTTMAAYAATVKRPDGLILESGFPDARSLIRSSPPLAFLGLFSTYRFPTADLLKHVDAPVLVMHGDRDRVVPFALGQELFERIPGPKQFVAIHGGDHNDVTPPDEAAYWTAVDAFIRTINR